MNIRFARLPLFFGMVLLGLNLGGCQKLADRYIDDYLERNGPKVMAKFQGRPRQMDAIQMEQQFDQQLKNPVQIVTTGSPSKGPENAPITLVEFSDFECPFCSRVVPTIQQLLSEYPTQIRIVFKHLPLPMHKNAMLAASASVAAQNQGRFWEMHDKIFANQQQLSEASIKQWAKELKLNMEKFTKDLNAPATIARIQEDMRIANSIDARSTPTFFINGAQIRGALPLEMWKKLIAKVMVK
jgi:protein-disulfide isomerase